MIEVRERRPEETGKAWKVEKDGQVVGECNCMENAKLYRNILLNRERRKRR